MALASQVAGAIRPSQIITWLYEDDTAVDLTGATLSGVIRSKRSGASRAIAGNLVLIDADAGQFRWDYDATDVAAAGLYRVQFTATYGENPTPAKTQMIDWLVQDALSVS